MNYRLKPLYFSYSLILSNQNYMSLDMIIFVKFKFNPFYSKPKLN